VNSILTTHLRGHLLLFEKPESPTSLASAGPRLINSLVFLELVLDPRTISWLQLPVPAPGFFMLAKLAFVLWLVPVYAGVDRAMLGFRRWRGWTKTESSYLVQVLVLACIIFPLALASQWEQSLAEHGWADLALMGLLPYFVFGFYQEVAYRGMLQTELVRRWGAVRGILAGNALYTFGPLHADYYTMGASTAIPLFLSVFAIGMLFAMVFRRSGNLWIVALMHGAGNALIAAGMGNLAF